MASTKLVRVGAVLSLVIAACGGSSADVGGEKTPGPTPGPVDPGQPPVPAPVITPGTVACGVTAPACGAPVSFAPALVTAVKTSSVGFRGTVTRLGDSTEPSIGPAERARSAVVRVDSVLGGFAGNDLLKGFVGKEITVLSPAAPTVAVGYDGYFLAFTSSIGVGIVVTEKLHADPSTYPTIETDVPAIAQTLKDRDLYDRLAKASVIAVATVESTRSLNTPPLGSEHSPDWQEGSVKVSCAVKGAAPAGGALAVRYSGSQDIAWHGSPKLAPLQTSAFVLANDDVTNVPGSAYVVTDARDVQPATSLAAIVTLLACPPPAL